MDPSILKSMWTSKTVWAGISAAVAGLIQTTIAVALAVGHPIDPAAAQVAQSVAGQIVDTATQAATVGITPDLILQLGTGIIGTLGGVGAIAGRLVATHRIG